jgi:hypothetical protein
VLPEDANVNASKDFMSFFIIVAFILSPGFGKSYRLEIKVTGG